MKKDNENSPKGKHTITIEKMTEVISLFLSGASVSDLAKKFRVTESTIDSVLEQRTLKSQRLKLSPTIRKQISIRKKEEHRRNHQGASNGRSKLTGTKVARIKQMLETTELTCREIGLKFGVSDRTIRMIRDGETWSWMSTSQPEQQTVVLELEPSYFTAKEAAQQLGIWKDYVYKLIKDGKLKGKKRGARWVFTVAEINRARKYLSRYAIAV